jgi:glutamyl-tRNA reductase
MADRTPLDITEPFSAELFVAGLSHRTAPTALRDRLMPDEGAGAERLLRAMTRAGLGQALVLATCDRIEVVGADAAAAAAAETALARLAEHGGLAPGAVRPHAYLRTGRDALRHLFEVAASLDSVVVGEPEILGQLKAAHRLAVEAGCVGPELEGGLQRAYAAAKRVRTETALAEQSVSLVAVAIKLARQIHGELGESGALLIGLGELGGAIARALQAQGLRRLWLATTAPARGALLARELGARALGIGELASALDRADIVLAAQSAAAPVLGSAELRAALARRKRRPMLLIDLGVPGDIAPEANGIEDAFLYTLDDLERISAGGRAGREQAAAAARAILDEELERFAREGAARAAAPALVALRRHFERARAEVLAHAGGLDADAATRLLINRLLHEPSTALKALAAEAAAHGPEERRRIERTLLKLFGIERRYGGDAAGGNAGEDTGSDAQS